MRLTFLMPCIAPYSGARIHTPNITMDQIMFLIPVTEFCIFEKCYTQCGASSSCLIVVSCYFIQSRSGINMFAKHTASKEKLT